MFLFSNRARREVIGSEEDELKGRPRRRFFLLSHQCANCASSSVEVVCAVVSLDFASDRALEEGGEVVGDSGSESPSAKLLNEAQSLSCDEIFRG